VRALAVLAGLALAAAAPGTAPAKKPRTKKHCVVKKRHGKRVRVCKPVKRKPKPTTTPITPVTLPGETVVSPTPQPTGSIGGTVSGGGDAPTTTSTTTNPAPPANPAPPLLPRRVGVDEYEYTVRPTYYTVAAGDLEFDPINTGMDAHDFSIRNGSGQIVSVPLASGESKVVNVNLPAGTYTLYCSLLDHETLGMKATLTVQ
jgi:plastocyanin